jgi:hypothetical protein
MEDFWLSERLLSRRMILPWKARPVKSPERPPLRDGARNAGVEIDSAAPPPRPIFPDEAKVKLIEKIKQAINSGESLQRVEPQTLSAAEVHRLYANTPVPEHRYLAPSLTEAVNSPEIAPHPAKWLAEIPQIDLPRVVNAWLNTNRSSEYEQLHCIGLDPDTGKLTGVLRVKHGCGYSGRPGTAGSREYVSFWVDWGFGFEYQGTASVTVHDFGCLPPAGLEYTVSLPVDLLTRMQTRIAGAKTVKVRAVLSWNTTPSTTDSNALVVWGNTMESRISIPPRLAARDGDRVTCNLTTGTSEIDQISTDGRIVDAVIRALRGMDFGPYAGLTVVPESAIDGAYATDQSFTINAEEIDDSGNPLTLCIWNRGNMNRDELEGLAGFPQKRTGSALRSGFRLQPLTKGRS